MYCALLGYIIFEGAEEDRNMNTLVDMISGMEVSSLMQLLAMRSLAEPERTPWVAQA